MDSCYKALTRRKCMTSDGTSKLKRVLGLWDLTFLGLGVTLGLGTYVLAGSVAKNHAGPAVCVCFLIAAIASALAGFCYAEFACRVPKAGSAYIYSYVTMGEFVAFIIGWNLVLEYVIGTAGLARGLSDYINALTGNVIADALRSAMPINISFLSSYPDFLSLLTMLILIAVMSNGAKESSMLNNVLSTINILLVVIVVGFGSTVVNIDLWSIAKKDIPEGVNGGEGGFLPFGVAGVLSGSAQCFFAFVGFDAVATTADEAKNPKRMIPLAIILCLFISFLAYFGVSTILTLMIPYYEQDEKAPFPYVFDRVNWPSVKWVATIGAIFAITSTLVGNMFALPRILYAMASDGLLFSQLARISERTKTPLVATAVTGLFAGIMATMFDIKQLVEMLSIGTLVAYTIVSLCVLMLRYRPEENTNYPNLDLPNDTKDNIPTAPLYLFKSLFNLNNNKYPDKLTNSIAIWSIFVFCIVSILICICIQYEQFLSVEHPYHLGVFVFFCAILAVTMIVLARQPEEKLEVAFKVPLVPLIPCASIFINLVLMSTSQLQTYIRIVVWLAVGFVIYFSYGIWHSEERKKQLSDKAPENTSVETATPTLATRF